uniref:carbonic anhydrase n=1 Tax=Candidatus Kentrum eta TaxID=2126337 RepID=A0A450UI23_9GAMM|nr:MAG: carbonic anhydrase [Candidatus Kentron sp. H]VFJ93142.1 MAG: carbonic anhydrase [Candidatus Kentron sp. H]VFK00001.1 MAG: carbonic anhydrase [Candidatus Kentron sp. H]
MKTKQFHIGLTASAALLMVDLAFAGAAGHGDVAWSHSGATGPEHWGDLSEKFILCKTGKAQSPIDITGPTKSNPPSLEIRYQSSTGAIDELYNGHTIEVHIDANNTIAIDNEPYKLLQFHFHTPSEHHIDGKAAPMELHLVHKNAKGEIAVIGVMMKEGKENPVLREIWENLPNELGEHTKRSGKTFDINGFLPEDKAYFHYSGSLTTPPCSEPVRWFVMKNPIELSREHIADFDRIVGHDNRPVQPLNGRDIFLSQ